MTRELLLTIGDWVYVFGASILIVAMVPILRQSLVRKQRGSSIVAGLFLVGAVLLVVGVLLGAGLGLVGPQRLYALAPGGALLAVALLAFDRDKAKIWWSKATTASTRELTAYLASVLALGLATGAFLTYLKQGQ